MKTKNLTLSAIFMAFGLVLHLIIPPLIFGVKPDFLLSMMFISLIIVDDIKEALIIGIGGGIMSSLTTNFPGGQIPNFIEKIIVSIIIFHLIKSMKKTSLTTIKILIIFSMGTLLSGLLFLSLALYFTNQMNLFFLSLPVVLVAVIINSIFGIILNKIYKKVLRHK